MKKHNFIIEKNKKEEIIHKKSQYSNIQTKIENSSVRNISNIIKPYLNKIIGNYYVLLHCSIMLCSGIILLFDNNISHLLILFNIACLDCIACVVLHDCPLTILENKYLYNSIVKDKSDILKKSNILYKCNHQYEKTLEFLTNMVSFIFGKIIILMLMKLFKLQINN